MTVLIAATLVVLAALDGMFAGFRASCGRTGRVRHRRDDLVAARRGLLLAAILLAPIGAVGLADLAVGAERLDVYRSGGRAMLGVYLPYGALVLLTLFGYLSLGWRMRFLASAVMLGPLTLVRPLVALAGAAFAAWQTRDMTVAVLALTAALAVLAVEGLAGRRWYTSRP